MKHLIFITIIIFGVTSKANALIGQEGGGGGHPCKSDFMQIYSDLGDIVKNDPQLLNSFPYLKTMLSVLDPKSTPRVNIEVLSEQIQNCPLSQNPIACANPKQNKISLYCGDNGWMGLNKEEKLKHVAHELLWWSYPTYDDADFFYTTKLLNTLRPFLYGHNLIAAAFLKPARPIQFEIDVSEIKQFMNGRFKFSQAKMHFQCNTFQPSYEPMTDISGLKDSSVYETKFSAVKNKKIIGSLEIKKEAWLESPPKESTMSTTHCTAALTVSFQYKFKEMIRPEDYNKYTDIEQITGTMFDSLSHVRSNAQVAVNMTESFLDATKGSYKLNWVRNGGTENKKECSILLSKYEQGVWMPKTKNGNFPCPKNFKE